MLARPYSGAHGFFPGCVLGVGRVVGGFGRVVVVTATVDDTTDVDVDVAVDVDVTVDVDVDVDVDVAVDVGVVVGAVVVAAAVVERRSVVGVSPGEYVRDVRTAVLGTASSGTLVRTVDDGDRAGALPSRARWSEGKPAVVVRLNTTRTTYNPHTPTATSATTRATLARRPVSSTNTP